MTDSNRMRTTTLLIDKPTNFDQLSKHYRLERYLVPTSFKFSKDKYKYGKLHICVKTQINYPYKDFSHDKIDLGADADYGDMVLYVLYPRTAQVSELILDFVSNDPLEHREIKFSDIELHMLVKLLQNTYFRNEHRPEFVAKGDCFIFVQQSKGYDVCLQVQINGDRSNKETDEVQVFQVSGRATRFGRYIVDEGETIDDWVKHNIPLFRRIIRHEQNIYNQLKPDEIDKYQDDLYKVARPKDNTRASLDFHVQPAFDRGRGKILYDFTHKFIEFLGGMGISAKHRWRDFHEYKAKNKDTLDLSKMGMVNIFDNRINKETIPITDFLQYFQERYTELTFSLLDNFESWESHPVLLFQDAHASDFAEKGLLARMDDPYKAIYYNPDYLHIPKQSINVNPNDPKIPDLENYLEYESVLELEGYNLRFDVCLRQLFLKQLVLYDKSVLGLLPSLQEKDSNLTQYIFVRRQTYNGENHTVALYTDKGVLHFLDLADPDDKRIFFDLLEARQVEWDDVHKVILEHQFKQKRPDKLVRFDVIIGNGIAIEIEDINERVLYNYDEIEKRLSETDDPRPINDFLLVPVYDEIKNKNMYHLAELEDEKKRKTKKGQRSLAFLEQLQQFDNFLGELEQTRNKISYKELASGDRLEKIGEIFELTRYKPTKKNPDPQYQHRKFKGYYQDQGMFLSLKAKDVILYKGIWYDDKNCYLVGNPKGMESKQDKASVIRRFNIIFGNEDLFDIEILLDTTAVQFVREKRYTSYPYFFHLINLYVSEVLQKMVVKDDEILEED